MNVWGMFAEVAARQPEALAVIDGERPMSFRELAALAAAFARAIPRGTRFVGVVLDHGVAQIACILGALRAGCAYVPAEPDFPPERVRFMMGEPPATVVFTQRDRAERLEGLPLRFVEDVFDEVAPNGRIVVPAGAESLPPSPATPDDLAYVLYTSGSTGTPKGVCVTNANVCAYARAFAAEFHPHSGDVMLQQSVCSFDIFVEEVFGALLNGATLAIPLGADRDDAESLLDYAARAGVTMASAFPYLLADWNRLGPLPPSLRLLISGGDVLRASYVDGLLPQATVYNTYGPSEATVCTTYFKVNGAKPLADGSYPIGRPVLGAGVMLVDEVGEPLTAEAVRRGVVGEICITGAGVAAGYVDPSRDVRPDGTGFGAFSTGERMFRSSDLGRWLPNGDLEFCGRKDKQVMIGGRRVEPGEVESVLCLSPEVAAALVVAREDERGLPYLTAYLVPSPSTASAMASASGPAGTGAAKGDRASAEAREATGADTPSPVAADANPGRSGAFPLGRVLERARRHLTSFMIPEFFALVDEIPLTANGKPDPSALPAILKPPIPKGRP